MKKIIIIIFLSMSLNNTAYNQIPAGCSDEDHPCYGVCQGVCQSSIDCLNCLATEPVPIDGGLLWLILGGAGLGVRRLMKNKKKEKG